MIKTFLLICLVLSFTSSNKHQKTPITNQEKQFAHWLGIQNKMYNTWQEYYLRLEIFIKNYAKSTAINSPIQMNRFADLEESEFLSIYTGYKGEPSERKNQVYYEPTTLDSIDWREQGAVTAVKNQGECGSCWAFSTTGSIEGANYLKQKYLLAFSEQQFVDCSGGSFRNQGCNGGLMTNAFQYAEQNRIQIQADYAYTAKDGKCKYDILKGVLTVKSYTNVGQSQEQLMAAIAKGPVSVAVDANGWQTYNSGIVDPCGPGTPQLNHGVLAVGYKQGSYWLVKNSWGQSWGESGYIRLQWGNTCGILNDASQPQV